MRMFILQVDLAPVARAVKASGLISKVFFDSLEKVPDLQVNSQIIVNEFVPNRVGIPS